MKEDSSMFLHIYIMFKITKYYIIKLRTIQDLKWTGFALVFSEVIYGLLFMFVVLKQSIFHKFVFNVSSPNHQNIMCLNITSSWNNILPMLVM